MKGIRDLLQEHPFFGDLPDADLDLLAGCGVNMRFSAGETIFREGEPADHFYVLRQGRVALEMEVVGKPPFVVTMLGAGEVLGASWLFPPHRWQFEAIALEDTAAVALDAACLRAKCDGDPALGYRLVQRFAGLLVRRLQATRLRLLDVYGNA